MKQPLDRKPLGEPSLEEQPTLDAAQDTFSAIATFVDRLTEAWETDTETPSLNRFVPREGHVRRLALIELIKVDLEYRWLVRSQPKHIEEYLAEYPELADGGVPIDLLYEEFHVRKQSGLNVQSDEFLERFPEAAQQLERLLAASVTSNSTAMFRPRQGDLVKDLKPGDKFDDFDLLAFLGKGAFASVFLARQNSMQRLVALKVSAIRGSEHQTLAQFDHDHIVRIYDQRTLPEHGAQLLYMQYVPGPTLLDVVSAIRKKPTEQRTGQLLLDVIDHALTERGESRAVESSIREHVANLSWSATVCWIGARLASALAHAHQRGVLHRDVKPANVLLTPEASPKLADFNVSFCSKIDGASPAAYFGGSLAYMSTEQLEACNPSHSREAETLDERSDVFSLGVVLCELLLAKRPFHDQAVASSWPQTLDRLVALRNAGVDLGTLDSTKQIPSGVRRVIQRCLQAEREQRWSSAEELAQQLELCSDAEAQEYMFPSENNWRARVRGKLLPLLVLVTVVPSALAAVFNFFYNRAEIIDRMDSAAESHFMMVQGIINGTAFPLGIALVIYLNYSVLRVCRRDALPNDAQLRFARKHGVRLGHYAALVCFALWTFAGLAYPLSMHLGQFSVSATIYTHFLVSLVLCGLFAVSLTFFSVTMLMLRAGLPAILEKQLPQQEGRVLTEMIARCSWIYLGMSASVPMLGTAALVAVNSPNIRAYLGVISVSGVIAFALVVQMFRVVLRDLQLLRRVCDGLEVDGLRKSVS